MSKTVFDSKCFVDNSNALNIFLYYNVFMFTNPVKNLKMFGLGENMIVADLGAGSGFYAIPAAGMVPNGKVYAIEIQKDFLTTIKNKATESHLDNIDYLLGDIEKIGGTKLKDNIVDAVIASNILFQVEDKNKFIEEIKGLSANNNIKGFETANDITKYLKEQFAGLFQRFLEEQTRIKEISIITNLEKTAQTLNKLVNYLSDENKDQAEELNRILTINHTLVETLRTLLSIPYNFYIEGIPDLNELLNARGMKKVEPEPWDEENGYFEWIKDTKRKTINLKVSKSLFEDEGRLKFVKKSDWKDDYVIFNETDKPEENDLPF